MHNRARNSKSFRGPEKERGCSKKLFLIILIVIIALTIFAVGLGVGIPAYLAKQKQKKLELLENRVNRSMSVLFQTMDTSVNPCSDFYQYVCGKFIKNAPENASRFDMNSLIQQKILENAMDLLRQPVGSSEPAYHNKIKNFFDSCMDEGTLEKLNVKPLTRLLEDLGKWPIISGRDWSSSSKTWIEYLMQIREKNIKSEFFMDISAQPNLYDESSYILTLTPPARLGLPVVFYQQNLTHVMEFYKKYMRDVVNYLGTNYKNELEVDEILDFEKKLANLVNPKDIPYTEMTITRLKREIPEIDWLSYMNYLLPITVTNDQKIQVKDLEYFREFSKLIWKVDMRLVANYVLWRIIGPNFQYLNKDAREIRVSFQRNFETQDTTRMKSCSDLTLYFLYLGLNAMYVRKYTDAGLKAAATDFIEKIKEEFLDTLDKLSWMDSESKEIAKNKICSMKMYIAYPDEFLRDDIINSFYSNLEIKKDEFFQNVLRIKWFETLQNFLLLTEAEKLRWTRRTDVLSPTASYSVKNELKITLPFLQGVYFDMQGLNTFNFGGLGAVVAHELFHAIDLKGGKYNEKGILKPWWTNETKLGFKQREECFIEQYNNYTIPIINQKINGIQTAAENLADNMGLSVAHKAFIRWINEHPEERDLPNVSFTPEQLFWTSFATKYCGKLSPRLLKITLPSAIHSPDMFRVIGPISNHPMFLKDFKCNQTYETGNESVCSII